MTDLSKLGEFGLIDHLTKKFPIRHKSSQKGVGDDAAVLDAQGRHIVVTTDMLVEHIHFDLAYTPLKHLGYKSVVVNLSDVYAMNAIPEQITVNIGVSSRFTVEALDEFYAGIRAACNFYHVDLVGGDTSSSVKGLYISITAIGYAQKEQISYRDGAKEGHILCLTGDVGAAFVGLQLLEREKAVYMENPKVQPDLEGQDYIVKRLLKPEARKDIIEAFRQAHLVPSSMIDVSDGLSSEVLHLCDSSDLGVLVEEEKVPIHPDMYDQALDFKLDPIICAMHGGEDYELLFTIDPDDLEKIHFMMDVKIIGEMIPKEDGRRLQTKAGRFVELTAQGFTHS